MNRFSVIYLLNEQYHHIFCETHSEASSVLKHIATKPGRISIGIYDAKTELFDWEPNGQSQYNEANIEEQGKLANQIITIAQALRRRDSSWQKVSHSQRPSFFA